MMQLPVEHVISIHGAPRSGTTWLGHIIDSHPSVRYKYQPLFSNSFKDRINVRSSKEDIISFFCELYYYDDEFLDRVHERAKGVHPVFANKNREPSILSMKMVRYHYLLPHLLYLFNQQLKVIGIVRHPCGCLNSWNKNPKEFFKGLNLREEWRFAQGRNFFKPEEYFGFHRWKELTKMFLILKEQYPDQFFMLKYEDLVAAPLQQSRELFNFCQLTFDEQTKDFLHQSTATSSEDPYSVYKANKNVVDWKNELDSEIIDEIYRELEGTEFEPFLKESGSNVN